MTARWQTGTVACGGEEIYYEVSGDDDLPAIMLTHGAGGTQPRGSSRCRRSRPMASA